MLNINSKLGVGTTIFCFFERDNIDRAPLGNMGETIMTIINSMDESELIYTHISDTETFVFNTMEIKTIIEGMDIKDNSVLLWIKEYINENVNIFFNR